MSRPVDEFWEAPGFPCHSNQNGEEERVVRYREKYLRRALEVSRKQVRVNPLYVQVDTVVHTTLR